jgi:hypothetical protein
MSFFTFRTVLVEDFVILLTSLVSNPYFLDNLGV